MREVKFTMVLTQPEREAMRRLAETEGGLSGAALLRRLVRKAAQQENVWPVDEQPQKREAQDHAG
jgi:hypothetical protein